MNALQESLGISPVTEEPEKDSRQTEKEPGLFEIIREISSSSEPSLLAWKEEKGKFPKAYTQYMINSAFGNFPDTILFANELNGRNIPDEMHYRFLFFALEKRKRFSEWYKKDKEEELILSAVATFYGCSRRTAMLYLRLLHESDITEIIDRLYREEKGIA